MFGFWHMIKASMHWEWLRFFLHITGFSPYCFRLNLYVTYRGAACAGNRSKYCFLAKTLTVLYVFKFNRSRQQRQIALFRCIKVFYESPFKSWLVSQLAIIDSWLLRTQLYGWARNAVAFTCSLRHVCSLNFKARGNALKSAPDAHFQLHQRLIS